MTKVSLRKKPISKARHSLYLDFYPPIPHPETGVLTRREFLGLYLFDKPKTTTDKDYNKETLDLAEGIRAQRQVDVQKEKYGFLVSGKKNINFVEYFKDQALKREKKNQANWNNAAVHIDAFFNGHIRIVDLNEKKCNDFRDYLLKAKAKNSEKPLSRNSVFTYFTKFKSALLRAYKDGLLDIDLSKLVTSVKRAETHRKYLTLDELQKLADTACNPPILKKAAIFSALTGLRFSDIFKLTWAEVHNVPNAGYHLSFRQQKTEGVEMLPISDQAAELLGERGELQEKVFKGLVYSSQWNNKLQVWIAKAGITKDITFHCFRHTYATLQLTLGTDIYTVSKMLGHKDLRMTQIYAKVVDTSKRAAANKIKLEM